MQEQMTNPKYGRGHAATEETLKRRVTKSGKISLPLDRSTQSNRRQINEWARS